MKRIKVGDLVRVKLSAVVAKYEPEDSDDPHKVGDYFLSRTNIRHSLGKEEAALVLAGPFESQPFKTAEMSANSLTLTVYRLWFPVSDKQGYVLDSHERDVPHITILQVANRP